LIDFHPCLIDPNQPAEQGHGAVRAIPRATTRSSVTQFICSDDHRSTGDYEEVNIVPPDSVLDIYREAATIGHSGSQGPNVLGQLTV